MAHMRVSSRSGSAMDAQRLTLAQSQHMHPTSHIQGRANKERTRSEQGAKRMGRYAYCARLRCFLCGVEMTSISTKNHAGKRTHAPSFALKTGT
jgi:hypothetical protein